MDAKDKALADAEWALSQVVNAASFKGYIGLDGHPTATWSIGPKVDVTGGLLDVVREALKACQDARGIQP